MDTIASQFQGGTPSGRQVPDGTERLSAMEGVRKEAQPGSKASRIALRHARDVLADFLQRDGKD